MPGHDPIPPDLVACLLAVGNSRCRVAALADGGVQHATAHPSGDAGGVAQAIRGVLDDHAGAPLVVASVHRPALDAVLDALGEGSVEAVIAGEDFGLPIQTTVREPERIGIDRLLCSLAAFRMADQACIVADAGTAITVDFVDGLGTHHGGAICPGIAAMLEGLARAAPTLPALSASDALASATGDADPWGADSREAMALGVRHAAVGLVHTLVDRFAQAYGGYPRVIATGGDAAALFGEDDIVEHVVPDLQLAGLAQAYAAALARADDADDE
ncbi:MAG: type III pantothenate kinase [Planctomycetota bacterium]